MADKRKSIPNTAGIKDSATRRFLDAAKEIIETGEGVRGDPLDRKLTWRDFFDAGFAKLAVSGGRYITPQMVTPLAPGVEAEINLSPPPAPGNVYTKPGIDIVFIGWDLPSSLYGHHSHANIYRLTEDNFSNATIYTQATGSLYADSVPFEVVDVEAGTHRGYYYWITFVSVAGIEGPPHDVNGVYGAPVISPTWMLNQLTDKITSTQLHADLTSPIQSITDEANVPGSVAYRIAAGDADVAQLVNELSSTVDDNYSAIQQRFEVIDGASATWQIKTEVALNGKRHVAGVGLSNNGLASTFLISASNFAVVDPSDPDKVILGTLNGSAVMDGAYMKTASIDDAAIGELSVTKLTGDTAGFVSANFGSITVTSAMIDDVIQSTNYSASAGWSISKSGALIARQANITGHINATSGYFKGALNAATGTFSGTMTASAVNAVNTINIGPDQVTIASTGTGSTFATAVVNAANGSISAVGYMRVTFTVGGGNSGSQGKITARIRIGSKYFYSSEDWVGESNQSITKYIPAVGAVESSSGNTSVVIDVNSTGSYTLNSSYCTVTGTGGKR
ncbi:MAG: phage tail tip fiber protein [Pseudomonadales bacterium]